VNFHNSLYMTVTAALSMGERCPAVLGSAWTTTGNVPSIASISSKNLALRLLSKRPAKRKKQYHEKNNLEFDTNSNKKVSAHQCG
jgi:hypothetical protein